MEKLVISGLRELAQVLGISVVTARKLTNTPGFPSARLGEKKIVVPVAALDEWLRKGGTEVKAG